MLTINWCLNYNFIVNIVPIMTCVYEYDNTYGLLYTLINSIIIILSHDSMTTSYNYYTGIIHTDIKE